MRKLLIFLFALIIATPSLAADNTVVLTPGSGVAMRTQDVGSGVQSPYNILGNVSGTSIYGTAGTSNAAVLSVQGIASGTALPVSLTSTTITGNVTAVQPTAASLNATVVGTGTFAVQATLAAETTKVIGTVNQGTSPWVVSLTSTTITGTVAATQSGAWNITNISGTVSLPTGASTAAKQPALGTAGTASSDVITVQGIASMTPLFGIIRDAAGNARGANVNASNQLSISCDNGCSSSTSITSWGGGTLGAMANYGTSPGAVLVPGVNAFVTNTNANGQATAANSSPVVLPAAQVSIGTAGSAATNVVTVQGIASMTKLLVTPDSVALPANQSVNVSQINAVTPLMGNGVTGTGSQRVTIASDNTAFSVNAVESGTWNITNISGTVSLPTGAATSANQTTWQSATGAAPPANAVYLGANASGATGGQLAGIVQCDNTIAYDASTNGSTQLVALTSGRSVYVCGYTILAAGTVNVKLIYGTGTACATGSNNLTPAYQLTAQVGLVDSSPFYRGLKTASANELCLNTSAGVAVQAIVYYAIL